MAAHSPNTHKADEFFLPVLEDGKPVWRGIAFPDYGPPQPLDYTDRQILRGDADICRAVKGIPMDRFVLFVTPDGTVPYSIVQTSPGYEKATYLERLEIKAAYERICPEPPNRLKGDPTLLVRLGLLGLT